MAVNGRTISPRPGHSPIRRREARWGMLFASPWILGFILFVGGPVIASFILSFSQYNIIRPIKFIGLDNYIKAFTADELFYSSLRRTFYYAGVMVPLGLAVSLMLAVLLNEQLRGRNVYRALFFLPSLTPIVASALLWQWILQPEVGLMNYLLGRIGIDGPSWLGSKAWAIPSLMLMALWGSAGGNRMLIFLAGLQSIEREMYEAAEIDGAGAVQRFFTITLPLLSPTIFFNLVLGIIGALQVFSAAFVATGGGPAYATWFFALHIYQNAFQFFNMGYASALAWVFFAILFLFTFLQFRMSERWVYYAGGSAS